MIIGAGVIGQRHAKAMAECDDCRLAGFVDVSAAARRVAERWDVPAFASIEDMLGQITPDGAIVATPTEAHFTPTQAMIERQIPVLVEKPLMGTVEEADAIVALTDTHNTPVLVGHQRRYYSRVVEAKAMIEDGTLGQLVTLHGQWNMRKNRSYFDPDWRKKRQAGPVLTNLIHEFDLLRFMCGEITSVSAEISNAVMGFEKEDAAAIVMRFESGALGTFLLSDQATSPWTWELALGENAAFPPTGQNATRFMGTKAALDFPNLALWHHGSGEADWNHQIEVSEKPGVVEDAFVLQLEHFCHVIAGECAPGVSATDARQSLRATLAVFEAAQTGARVKLI